MSKELNTNAGLHTVIDAFFGDGGKGKTGYALASVLNAVMVDRSMGGGNPEHGAFFEGHYIKTHQLPLSFLASENSIIGLGCGVAVDLELLFKEINEFGLDRERIKIDYRCPIITPEDKERERNNPNMKKIGSTFSGTGETRKNEIGRTALRAEDYIRKMPELKRFICDVSSLVLEKSKLDPVIVETSQGTGLSLHSPFYPNTTSGDINTLSAINGLGIGNVQPKEVYMLVKTMPTREGAGRFELPGYHDVPEFTEEEMRKLDIVEYSSIGGVIRRKAKHIPWHLLEWSTMQNRPTQVIMTFCDHWDKSITNHRDKETITEKIAELKNHVEKVTGTPVTALETGKNYDSFIDLLDTRAGSLSEIANKIDYRAVKNAIASSNQY